MNREDFIVGLDVDGVLRNWLQAILQQINAVYNTRFFNKHITAYNFIPIIKEQIPEFNRKTLTEVHRQCAESGQLAQASAYKDGLTLLQDIYEAEFAIKLVTYQPAWAKESFYQWLVWNEILDKVEGVDFVEPAGKADTKVHLLIDDNPSVIEAAAVRLKPSVLWQRNWNRSWQYPAKDIPQDLICCTVLPKKALRFIEYWAEKLE